MMSNTDSSSSVAQGRQDLETLWHDIKKTFSTRDEESTPTMVFSVIGDSDSCVPSPWPKTVFKTALIEASKRGGETVILFRGNCDRGGVSNVVKDAYQLYEDMEFGGKEKAMNDPKRHIKLVNMTEERQRVERGVPTTNTCENEKSEQFILDFEKFVSKQKIFYFGESIQFKIPVPIVILVCEGDIKTISHISKALQSKLPVIILKGSGNAADFVHDLINTPKFKVKEHLQNASFIFNTDLDDPNFSKLAKDLHAIRKNRDLIGVLDLDRDDPHMLSSIVGKALVSCWSSKRTNKKNVKEKEIQTKGANNHWFLLASDRKCFDTSLSSFFNCMDSIDSSQLLKGLKWGSRPHESNPKTCTSTSLPFYFYFGYRILQQKTKLFDECGEVFLLEALKANRCDYVRVLLDRGVKFNINNLSELYEQTITCQECMLEEKDCLHLTWILNQISEAKALCNHLLKASKIAVNGKETEGFCSKAICLCLLKARNTCTCIVGKAPEENPNQRVRKAANKLCCEILRYPCDEKTDQEDQEDQEESIADVLLWAILLNRQELAEICWSGCKDRLLTGLVCSAILEQLSKKAHDANEPVLATDLEEHSKIFQRRCISVMDEMYKENRIDLMGTEKVIWGIRSSPLTFAFEHFMYDVVAHECSHKYMNNKWKNREPLRQSVWNKTTNFIRAPRTKFVLNYVMFFLVLSMYSYFVLTSISPPFYDTTGARVLEYSMYIWSAGDFIEELIACFGWKKKSDRPHRSCCFRIFRHIQDFWNVVDLLSYVFLVIALCVRHVYPDHTYTFARHMFGLALLVMYLRILEMVLLLRILGPTLIVIKEMLKDMLRFLFIAAVIVLGVGIYKHAITWPDCQRIWSNDWTKWRIWNIIQYGYSQLYDEQLDFLDNHENCTNKGTLWTTDPSKNQSWVVDTIVGLYMLILNFVLANLIIAMFSYSYDTVQVDAEKLWRFQRYTVIYDYIGRIPSPINLIIRFRQLVKYLYSKCKSFCNKKVSHADNQKKEIGTSKENNPVQK